MEIEESKTAHLFRASAMNSQLTCMLLLNLGNVIKMQEATDVPASPVLWQF